MVALTWGVTPPRALPPEGDAVVFCRGMPLYMPGSLEQPAFVITATFWSRGRATVSPGWISKGAARGTNGHFAEQKSRDFQRTAGAAPRAHSPHI